MNGADEQGTIATSMSFILSLVQTRTRSRSEMLTCSRMFPCGRTEIPNYDCFGTRNNRGRDQDLVSLPLSTYMPFPASRSRFPVGMRGI